jgi:dephospho-CoA kinase
MDKKFKIGITGGIGSGKSLVSDFFESEGFVVLRADPLAKEMMQTDMKIIKKIKQAFGEQSYSNEKLDTKFLAKEIFEKEENVEKINSIVHPPVLRLIDKKADEVLLTKNLVFIESALIYEARFQKMFDHVILICADEKIRIERTAARDKINAEEIEKRTQFQLPDEIKREKASFVIENNATVEELKQKSKFILNLLTSLTK